MAEILAFRSSTPVIRLTGAADSYFVNVRPCPVHMPTLRHFETYSDAMDHAVHLQREYGWRVDIDCHQGGFDGAA